VTLLQDAITTLINAVPTTLLGDILNSLFSNANVTLLQNAIMTLINAVPTAMLGDILNSLFSNANATLLQDAITTLINAVPTTILGDILKSLFSKANVTLLEEAITTLLNALPTSLFENMMITLFSNTSGVLLKNAVTTLFSAVPIKVIKRIISTVLSSIPIPVLENTVTTLFNDLFNAADVLHIPTNITINNTFSVPLQLLSANLTVFYGAYNTSSPLQIGSFLGNFNADNCGCGYPILPPNQVSIVPCAQIVADVDILLDEFVSALNRTNNVTVLLLDIVDHLDPVLEALLQSAPIASPIFSAIASLLPASTESSSSLRLSSFGTLEVAIGGPSGLVAAMQTIQYDVPSSFGWSCPTKGSVTCGCGESAPGVYDSECPTPSTWTA